MGVGVGEAMGDWRPREEKSGLLRGGWRMIKDGREIKSVRVGRAQQYSRGGWGEGWGGERGWVGRGARCAVCCGLVYFVGLGWGRFGWAVLNCALCFCAVLSCTVLCWALRRCVMLCSTLCSAV